MQENTTKHQLAKIVTRQTKNLLINLYLRWADEKEYEDFSEYEEVISSEVLKIEGVDFLRSTQRPFGFQFRTPEGTYHYTIKTKGNQLHLSLQAIPPLSNIKRSLASTPPENSSSLKSKKRRKK